MQESAKFERIGYRGSRILEYTKLSHFTVLFRSCGATTAP